MDGDILKIQEKLKWSGDYIIQVRKKKSGKITKKYIISNQITDLGLDEIIKGFQGDYVNLEIKELAIGEGSTAPSASDTELEDEVYRVTVSENDRTDTGVNTASFTLNGSEYTGTITELGLFAGTDADPWNGGLGKDTGLLISRVSANIEIEADEEAYFQRIDTISA